MELNLIWRVIVRRWWIIVLPALVALVISLPALRSVISPPISYITSIRFTASPKPGTSGTFQDQSYTPWLASEYAVTNLAAWIHTDSFAREVDVLLTAEGKTAINADQVRAALNSDSARSIMTVYIKWPDPDELKLIGQACIDTLANKADTYFPEASAQKLLVVPLDQVSVASDVPPITARLAPLARIGVGLALGIALAFLAEYLDRTLRTRAEVEHLGLPVVAEIPR